MLLSFEKRIASCILDSRITPYAIDMNCQYEKNGYEAFNEIFRE